MTKIDFYLLGKDNTDKSGFACRLAQKAFKQGCKIYIYSDHLNQVEKMDKLLWTFRQDSFLPHCVTKDMMQENTTGNGLNTPIVLGSIPPPPAIHDVLINLADTTPEFFSSFDRVAEIVDDDDSAKMHARKRYQYYRDRGYELETHNI